MPHRVNETNVPINRGQLDQCSTGETHVVWLSGTTGELWAGVANSVAPSPAGWYCTVLSELAGWKGGALLATSTQRSRVHGWPVQHRAFHFKPSFFRKRVRKVIREVGGIRSGEEIEYFQEKGLKCDKWSEVKGFWSVGKSSIYREKVRKVLSDVKWRDFEMWTKSGICKNTSWKVTSEVKWSEVKWSEVKCGEGQLNAVKGKELKLGEMWSVCKGNELEWGVGFGKTCETECRTVWFADCSVYRVAFNTDSSTLGSTRFLVLMVYDRRFWFCFF